MPTIEDLLKLQNEKNAVYDERNKLVCALSKLFPSYLARHPKSDTTWDDDWRWIVFIYIPTNRGSEQISWHIHDSDFPMFSNHLGTESNNWDGHTTAEKYDRLARLEIFLAHEIKPMDPKESQYIVDALRSRENDS
jgi:hypothetical protein